MDDFFKSKYGPDDDALLDALLKVHDHVGNAHKRSWALLAKVAEDAFMDGSEANLELLAAALVDAARGQLNDMIAAVHGTGELLSHDQARVAVLETDVGQTLSDLLENAERAASAASQVSKRIDASLAKKANERRQMVRAKEIQLTKAREGRPVSLLQAIEIAKAAG